MDRLALQSAVLVQASTHRGHGKERIARIINGIVLNSADPNNSQVTHGVVAALSVLKDWR
jgi:hypothetical protein